MGNNKFFLFIVTVFIFAYTNCSGALDYEYSVNYFDGKFIMHSTRYHEEIFETFTYNDDVVMIYNFNKNSNILEKEIIIKELEFDLGTFYKEYEIKNGKYRERSVTIFHGDYESKFGPIGEWTEWANYIINNELFEIEYQTNYYISYKKL